MDFITWVMPTLGNGGDRVKCGFCDQSRHDARYLMAGPGVYTCDQHVERLHDDIAAMNKTIREGPVAVDNLT
jgi:hypothetical protein